MKQVELRIEDHEQRHVVRHTIVVELDDEPGIHMEILHDLRTVDQFLKNMTIS